MKNINFKTITIINFLSIGTEPVKIKFENGIHIITGTNKDKEDRRNGVGKSTIVDALYFTIFGTTLRDIKKEFIPNSVIHNATAVVELVFDIEVNNTVTEYKIIRALNPSKCYLYKDGADITRDTIVNTSKEIQKLLNATPEIFKNCVFMTLNDSVPFMGQNKVAKRKFIEAIFNLEVFSIMLTKVRSQLTETKKDFDIETTKKDEILRSIKLVEKQQHQESVDKIESLKNLKIKKDSNLKEITNLRIKNNSFSDSLSGNIIKTRDRIERAIKEYSDNLSNLKDTLAELHAQSKVDVQTAKKMGTSESVCPVCLRSIDEDDNLHILEERYTLIGTIETRKKKIDTLTKEIESETIKINKLKSALLNYNKQIIENETNTKNINEKIVQLSKYNEEIDSEFDKIQSKVSYFDNIINEHQQNLLKATSLSEKLKEKLNLLDTVKFVVSEEGVKSYIVNKILSVFNTKIKQYIKRLDGNCILSFNEYFEDEIFSESGNLASYFNFSGAEKKAIDLAIVFTFIQLNRAQRGITYNVIFFDELLDSSLDEKGIEIVFRILKEDFQDNLGIYVITHRKEMAYKVNNTILLEKSEGITRLVS
jgi:DNA repair exonuclease SbcCD ATPase subunit